MSLQKRNLRQLLAPNGPLSTTLHSLLRPLPVVAKWLVIIVFLLNMRSWPFMWHLRVFRRVFILRLQLRLVTLRTLFSSKATKDKRIDEWCDSITPIGENPFEKVVGYRTRATIDECDFNGHLSNSSYAKALDSARFETALKMFPMFFRSGGWMALGGTHFHFLREIPMLAEYEVRTSIATWDQKWLFIVHRFVSKPKGKGKKSRTRTPEPNSTSTNGTAETGEENILHASLRTPATLDATSNTGTPLAIGTPVGRDSQETPLIMKAVAAGLATKEEPDGAILHTFAISEACFKIGRITVPPALAFGVNGLCAPPPHTASSSAAYSRTNPHPQWAKAKSVMSIPNGGSTKALRELFKGGWRDMPESERWWDQALSGIEQQRRARLGAVGILKSGMDAARAAV